MELNGLMVLRLINDAEYLKQIAKEALIETENDH